MRTKILQLMAQKQAAEGRVINGSIVADESGITRQTVYKWISGDLKRFDENTVIALCNYFGCDMSDLLYLDRQAQ